MIVARAGYFNGAYPQPGDVISVDDPELATTLELSGFARRDPAQAPPPASVRRTKGSTDDKH